MDSGNSGEELSGGEEVCNETGGGGLWISVAATRLVASRLLKSRLFSTKL